MAGSSFAVNLRVPRPGFPITTISATVSYINPSGHRYFTAKYYPPQGGLQLNNSYETQSCREIQEGTTPAPSQRGSRGSGRLLCVSSLGDECYSAYDMSSDANRVVNQYHRNRSGNFGVTVMRLLDRGIQWRIDPDYDRRTPIYPPSITRGVPTYLKVYGPIDIRNS